VKITKLSLAAVTAMTLTTGAMAEVTTNFSGDAKLWYETADSSDNTGSATSGNGLFHQKASGFTAGQAAISVEAKGKAGVLGYGVKYTAVDTLGLESNLVSGVRVQGASSALDTAHWAEKAFITYSMGKTTAKIGRQHLNTPLAFTEKWNVAANSFDAAVLINSDIENVTLIGAYVGRGNGSAFGPNAINISGNPTVGGTGTLAKNGRFSKFGEGNYGTPLGNVQLAGSGAYAAAALVKPTKELGINGWYYNVQDIADAVWLDANYDISGVKLGAIYAQMMPKGQISSHADTKGFALKAGTKAGPVSLFAAYSSIDTTGAGTAASVLPIANVATGFKKTKLPTAGVYNDGLIVAQPGSDTFKIKAGMPAGPVKLTAQYISAKNDTWAGKDVDEFDFIVGAKVADINVKAIYVNRKFKNDAAVGNVGNSDSDHIRVIAGINF
jgi:hypothetical protein